MLKVKLISKENEGGFVHAAEAAPVAAATVAASVVLVEAATEVVLAAKVDVEVEPVTAASDAACRVELLAQNYEIGELDSAKKANKIPGRQRRLLRRW